MPETTTPTNRGTVTLSVTNLGPADEQFLKNVVALFTDPANESHAHAFRVGEKRISYEGKGGLCVIPVTKARQ